MAASASEERARLDELYTLGILDTPTEPIFDELVRFAASLLKTPIATITLIDQSRQWFKASIGLNVTETPLEISFCNHAVINKRPFIVENAASDPEFADNPLVSGPPFIQFYAGVPLLTKQGFAIGTLSVMDRKSRKLSRAKLESLGMLARQAMTNIELWHQRNKLNSVLASFEEMNRQLQKQSRHLRQAQRIARLGSWEMDCISCRLLLSDEVYRIFGVKKGDPAVTFDAYLQSVHPEDRDEVVHAVEQSTKGYIPLDLIHRIVRTNKEVRYVHERGQLTTIEDGQIRLAGTVQDITASHISQQERDLLYTSISRVNDAVMITEASPIDEPGPRIVFVNRAFEERTGYHHTEVIGRSPRLLQGEQTQRNQLQLVREALKHCRPVSVEVINYTKHGTPFWVEMDIAPVAIQGETITHFVSVQRDITQRKIAEGQIERLAFFDPLTDLPNRRLLMDRLEHAVETAHRKRNRAALLFIDLDNFKSLNDTLGHFKGDLLLSQVARRLEKVVRKSNTVARLGGDEFVILLEDLASVSAEAAAEAEIVSEKLLACFVQPFDVSGQEHNCTPSIGIAMFDGHAVKADEILKRADVAMYEAKAAGRNTVRFFDRQMQSQINTRVKLDRDFRSALQNNQFVLHYQPQIDDAGRLSGAEALVRWQHPQRGLLYPRDFIWLAEENGSIVNLGQWVLQSVCEQLQSWQPHSNLPAPRIAINVSAREFHHPDFLESTLKVLETTGINPNRIKLELTESVLVEQVDDTVAKMVALKARGVRFSLDDFGTGFSSLSYLKKLPLDEIKIDKGFVRDILVNPDDAAIAQTIVSLCQILGFEVIAEGVESEGQRDMLASQGCRHYQGYWVGRPLPASLLQLPA